MNRMTSNLGSAWTIALLTVGTATLPVSAESSWGDRAESVSQRRLSEARATFVNPECAPRFRELPRFSLAAAQEADLPAAGTESDDGPQTRPSEESAEPAPVERGPLPSFGATVRRDLKALPRVLWHDTKAAFGDPWNLALLGAAGGASIALRTTNADYHVDEYYRERHTFDGDWPDTFATLGNPALHFAMAGVWYVAGQQLQDDKTYEVGRKLFNALAITGVSTMFLKVAAWDDSPNGEWGAWPSGHVSSTMTVATVLNGAYGPLVGVPMFGLTALVGVERMDDREHWLSDVVFGAVLGWVVGETVVKEHRPEILGGEVVPYVDPVRGGAGVAWVKPLGLDSARASR
jgi:membrane-associated phospholipid phosphatase